MFSGPPKPAIQNVVFRFWALCAFFRLLRSPSPKTGFRDPFSSATTRRDLHPAVFRSDFKIFFAILLIQRSFKKAFFYTRSPEQKFVERARVSPKSGILPPPAPTSFGRLSIGLRVTHPFLVFSNSENAAEQNVVSRFLGYVVTFWVLIVLELTFRDLCRYYTFPMEFFNFYCKQMAHSGLGPLPGTWKRVQSPSRITIFNVRLNELSFTTLFSVHFSAWIFFFLTIFSRGEAARVVAPRSGAT